VTLTDWDHGVEQWILRLNLLAQWCPELGLPPITDAARRDLVQQLCHGAFSYKDIKDKPVRPLVKGWLSPQQQEWVDQHAPERLTLANGRAPKVVYDAANPPHIAVRIQELFDVNSTPRIAMGRVPVLVHILAPNMRPVQITQDLAGFWREHYPRIKQELQRNIPNTPGDEAAPRFEGSRWKRARGAAPPGRSASLRLGAAQPAPGQETAGFGWNFRWNALANPGERLHIASNCYLYMADVAINILRMFRASIT
jgi:hypothetical protein